MGFSTRFWFGGRMFHPFLRDLVRTDGNDFLEYRFSRFFIVFCIRSLFISLSDMVLLWEKNKTHLVFFLINFLTLPKKKRKKVNACGMWRDIIILPSHSYSLIIWKSLIVASTELKVLYHNNGALLLSLAYIFSHQSQYKLLTSLYFQCKLSEWGGVFSYLLGWKKDM